MQLCTHFTSYSKEPYIQYSLALSPPPNAHTHVQRFVSQQTKINTDFTQLIKHDLVGFGTRKQWI